MDVVSVLDDLVTGKMSRDNWIALCNRVEISQVLLYPTATPAESGA